MGRPKIEQSGKLSKWFSFRVTEDELNKIHAAADACGRDAAILVRDKLFKGRFPAAKPSKLDLHAYTELKKIGVNLNQITRKVNAGIVPKELLTVLFKLEQKQEYIIGKLLYDSGAENR